RRPPSSTLSPYTTLFRSGVRDSDASHFLLQRCSLLSNGKFQLASLNRRKHLPDLYEVAKVKKHLGYLTFHLITDGNLFVRIKSSDRKSTRLNSSHVAISY